MRNFIKKITHPFLKAYLKLYYRKPRNYCYDGICVKVHPDVFPPHLTLSTRLLLDFIKPMNLQGKQFLELGCGSGIISLYAAKKGAAVTASDINPTALEYLKMNSEKNNHTLKIVHSDLFKNLNSQYDFIIINPPYYPKKPKNIKEQAWFCGENFEYFEELFQQLKDVQSPEMFMILSKDCDLEKINQIAVKNDVSLECIFSKKKIGEINYVYKIHN